jgi:hypothetical protein
MYFKEVSNKVLLINMSQKGGSPKTKVDDPHTPEVFAFLQDSQEAWNR